MIPPGGILSTEEYALRYTHEPQHALRSPRPYVRPPPYRDVHPHVCHGGFNSKRAPQLQSALYGHTHGFPDARAGGPAHELDVSKQET